MMRSERHTPRTCDHPDLCDSCQTAVEQYDDLDVEPTTQAELDAADKEARWDR